MFPEVTKYENVERYCVCGVDTIYYKIINEEVEIVAIVGTQNY